MRKISVLTAALPVAALLMVAPMAAQTSDLGIGFMASSDGKSVGTCRELSCVPHRFTVNQGKKLSLSVFGGSGNPFLIAAAATTAPCIDVPGISGQLALHAPTTVLLSAGVLKRSFNHCGRGQGTVTLPVPSDLPGGVTAAFQALSMPLPGSLPLTLSRPILVTTAVPPPGT